MEEDLSAKVAPVTRLRRRLSVDPEDSPLPTTPSTPSKKRNTRLAAKPQLELIDEVAAENIPKRTTRKTAVKDVESEATGLVTPTPVTPSRRSTRVRSNTSLLSETIAQSVESPRAKRALRRTSQLGSDNESAAPITPARQTRQTRKDSVSNVDKPAATPEENIAVLTVIYTETSTKEETQKDPETNKYKAASPTVRKSPRLSKKNGNTDETDNIHIETAVHSAQDNNPVVPIKPAKGDQIESNTAHSKEINIEIEMLSTSTVNLINNMNTSDKKTTSLNKSTTSLDKSINDIQNKRNRTKSWTTLTASPSNVGLTDDKGDSTENLIARYRSMSSSGDGIQNNLKSSKLEDLEINSINKSKTSFLNTSTENKENLVVSDPMKVFENLPLNEKPMILIEDSDSGSYDKLVMDIQIGEDQCVPEGKPANQTPKDSIEPMDIDETMPENVTIDDFSDKSNGSKDEIEVPEKRKSSISDKSLLNDKSINKSKRKSSISKQASDTTPRNSLCEDDKNKSIPTQILDIAQNSFENTIDNNTSRKNSVSFREEILENLNESKRKSSVSQTELENQNVPDSKINQAKDELSSSLNKSTRKSSLTLENNIEKLDDSINISKKNVSISQNYCETDQMKKSLNKSQRKSSTSIVDDNLEKLYGSCNIASGLQNKSGMEITEEANNKSIRKKSLSFSKENNSESLNEISNKSKSKSSNSQINSFVEDDSKSANKSKRTSSHPQTESSILEKSGNENKNTFVFSQLKDVSTNDSKLAVTSQNLTNELSKSVSGPVVKSKVIDKINLSPKNYLTSTPIQQKSLQNMAMQINTSIISPAMENKNVTIEKTSKFNEIEEDKKLKKKMSRAPSSSASSDEEIEPKSSSILAMKKSPKKIPAPDSSESEIESPRKIINKKKLKRVQALNSSSDEESDIVENQQKIPNKQNNQVKKVKAPKNTPVTPDTNTSDSEESEAEVSKDKKKMFDDEASEASDDYESGDSRSDEEKQYENDNEIIEKGETLDSEEELSNDSDYERDSFIVSSDAEDNEILSGTGDDLSMSDNELTMSAKSKKKFNERKLKEQKKASREMYEARHKDDSAASSTANISKSKKSKLRQRLDSSTLVSENDSEKKKYNRPRIDSSQDSANSADESIGIKKKKSKRLSASVCETTMNEKEISLFNQTTEKNDPLTAAIKLEPKTPKKDFSISSVAINDNIEEVQVDHDVDASIEKHSDTLDPLQATMAVDDEDDEDSLSENNEIIDNYDSVLNNLNFQTKSKTHEVSLNLNKKVKNTKNPVIDQLNLTQTKKSEKNKNNKNQQAEMVKPKLKENLGMDEEDSSDYIDMKLLFSEESTDSEANSSKFKSDGNKPSEPDTIIPLKRTEAKTNLLDKTDMNSTLNESSLNGSKNKNKKRKTSQSSQPEDSMILDNGIQIIVDTLGTHEEDSLSQAATNSSKKKNKKNKSLNETAAFELAADIDCTDGFTLTEETSITSEKKNKKNKSFDGSMNSINVSGSHSDKKSRKISQSTSSFIETVENQEETMMEGILVNTSIKSEKKNKNKDASVIAEPDADTQSAKKKSKKISISEENKSHEETMMEGILVNTSIKSEKKKKNKDASVVAEPDAETQSAKKKSKKISISEENKSHEETMMEGILVNTSIKSEKKKKNKDASVVAEPDADTQSAKKKSKKISISEENKSHEATMMEGILVNTSIKSAKKKKNKDASVVAEPVAEETQSAKKKSKKISFSEENKAQDESDDAPEEVSYQSAKKSDATDNVTDDAVTTSSKKKFKKNKKKKNKNKAQPDDKLDVANAPTDQEDSELKKRKRKVSNNPETDDAANVISMESVPTRNQKKKYKVNLDEDYAAAYDNNTQSNNDDDTSAKKSKKDKSKKNLKEDIPQNKAKKRKHRENDDNVEKICKVSKQDSLDEIHVPRLPETILKQLTEKPTKTAISTMPFSVKEGGRRNKPSEYLEQSVYLNNSPVRKKKHSKHTNPKVLPFIPTALTSDNGCTSRFNISLLPKDTQFVAQASNTNNFKEAFLGTQRIKKMGTLERCKIQRSRKLSKF